MAERDVAPAGMKPMTIDRVAPSAPAHGTARRWLAAARGARRERWGDATMGYLFLAPMLALYITFQGYPILRGLMIAFSDYRFLIPDHQRFNRLDNFVEIAADGEFWRALGRSAYFFALYFPLNFCLGLAVALLISHVYQSVEASFYRVASYLPVVLPIAVAVLMWKHLFDPQFGYVNHLLRDGLGVRHPPGWFAEAEWVIPTLAGAALWKHLGSTILLFLIGLYNVNRELYEAAAIDGAGAWTQFRRITLPLLRPTTALVLVLSAGMIATAEESLVMFGPKDRGPMDAGLLAGRYGYEVGFLLGDMRWGYASAISLVLAAISIALSALVFHSLRSERAE